MNDTNPNLGRQVLAKLYGCSPEQITKADTLYGIITRSALEAGFSIVKGDYHQFRVEGKPHGASAYLILKESHFGVHSWPEKGILDVDIYTCGEEGNPVDGLEALCSYLEPDRVEKQVFNR